MHDSLINDFANNPYPVFPIYPRTMLLRFAERHGLSRQLPNQVLTEQLVAIYRHLGEYRRLGEQSRQERENRLEEQLRQELDPQQDHFENIYNMATNTPFPTPIAPDPPLPQRPTIELRNRVLNLYNIPLPLRFVQNRFNHESLSYDGLNELRRSFDILSQEISIELNLREELSKKPKYTVTVDSSKFETIETEYECPVCYITKSPVLTNCDHAFCGDCIKQMSRTTAHSKCISCALCRADVTTIFVSDFETANQMTNL
jgi:hypothetical protein